ncbi:MAG: PEP-CTERM sorting domain-containing protein [Bythopirellula sp.]|nr:PEP-CTERM sorting domain-containing protein [Bythopirellula sp.]
MRILSRQISGVVFILGCLFCSLASAININLQYPPGFLFSAMHDPAARDAIDEAAADISAAITSNLSAINTDLYSGINGNATATFNWSYSYSNPLTGGSVTIDTATIPANTVTMYVGARSILGSTLGVGGPGGAGFSLSGTYSTPNQWPGAVDIGESQSELAYKRGGGPVIGTLEGTSVAEGFVGTYSIDFGIAYGSLSLDWDGNNNGAKDNDTDLNNYWHFNHTTSVGAGKNDLYSVALHEMLHALGIGASDSWDDLVSGTTWDGSNASTLYGSGNGLINPAGDHIASGIMSTSILDGSPQEVVMDPSITQGTRKRLTALDLAFLRDIGYATIIPTPSFSPADFNEDADVDSGDLATWQTAYGLNANGDTNNDGDSDGRDFLLWQREYTGSLPFTATVAVPEPSAFLLLLASGVTLLGYRRRTR